MKFPSIKNRKHPLILFYSGFLSCDGTREATPSKNRPDDWHTALTGFFGGYGSVHRVTWPACKQLNLISGGIAGLFTGPVGAAALTAYSAKSAWDLAIKNADREAAVLAEWIDSHDHETIIAGHSLGGRIVLKAAQMAQSGVHVVAFAPAIFTDEIQMEELYSPHRTVEIYRSPSDDVLNYAYRLGQLKFGEVVGRHGVPSRPHYNRGIHCFDANKVISTSDIGHNDYAMNLPRLRPHSALLKQLRGHPYNPDSHRLR